MMTVVVVVIITISASVYITMIEFTNHSSMSAFHAACLVSSVDTQQFIFSTSAKAYNLVVTMVC